MSHDIPLDIPGHHDKQISPGYLFNWQIQGYERISQPDSQGYPDLSERSKLEIIPLYILTVTGVSQVVVDSHWHDATRWSYPPGRAGPSGPGDDSGMMISLGYPWMKGTYPRGRVFRWVVPESHCRAAPASPGTGEARAHRWRARAVGGPRQHRRCARRATPLTLVSKKRKAIPPRR